MVMIQPSASLGSYELEEYLDTFPTRILECSKLRSPARPVQLPDDSAILAILARSRTEKGVTRADDVDTLELFSAWRAAVYKTEVQNMCRIQTLFCYLKAEEARASGETTDESRRTRLFVKRQFGRFPPKTFTDRAMAWEPWALSVETLVMSSVLRNGGSADE